MAISIIEVKKAAEKLIENGVNPTLANVRKELGGGSFTTISELMKEWKSEQEELNLPAPIVIPESVNNAISTIKEDVDKAAAMIWHIAQSTASSDLDEEREALQAAKRSQEENEKNVAEMADQMEEELILLKSKNEDLTSELDETKKNKDEILSQNIIIQNNLENEKEKCGNLNLEIESVRKSESQSAKESAKLSGIILGKDSEIKNQKATVDSLNQEIVSLTKSNAESQSANANLEKEIKKHEPTVKSLEEDKAKSRIQNAVLTEQNSNQNKQHKIDLKNKDEEIKRLNMLLEKFSEKTKTDKKVEK